MDKTAARDGQGEFCNQPFIDFKNPENRRAMEEALKSVAAKLGHEYPNIVGGEKVFTPQKIRSINPAHPDQIVGVFQSATVEMARHAVEVAHAAFAYWKRVPAAERVACIFRVVEILRRRRFEFAALLVYEIGKSWPEADADIAELIDFAGFYAREMLRLAQPQPLTPVHGEKNYLVYIPLGVGIVIPPWNFAAAIMGGMTVAAIVTGNTAVVKPSSDSPTVAAWFMEVLSEAGVPPGVVNFLSGPGSSAGEAMVAHPLTRFIAFTGSKDAGLRISERAAQHQPGQLWIKRTVLEMGGKDAIVVDDDADLAAAADGVVQAAFGYQGQKCSACSRAIVSEKVYDKFIELLLPRVQALRVGPPENSDSFMGPVINESSMKSILGYIEVGKKEGRLVAGGAPASGEGFFVQPTVIADLSPKSRIAQEEIFGPVLAVIKARDFDDALNIANDSEFGLTGALYSHNPDNLERARHEFHVGNLYLNRKCTGALVGAHPFGGFNLSGTDSKAGGRDYLLLFLQAKTVAEKIG